MEPLISHDVWKAFAHKTDQGVYIKQLRSFTKESEVVCRFVGILIELLEFKHFTRVQGAIANKDTFERTAAFLEGNAELRHLLCSLLDNKERTHGLRD